VTREIIHTNDAPKAIGTYSQAVKVDSVVGSTVTSTVYLSGQIPLDPATMEIVDSDISMQVTRVFDNLQAVVGAAGGTLADIVKLNIFLTDMNDFPVINEIMAKYFQQPYPARAAIGVASLPKNVDVEMDAIMVLSK